MSFSIRSRCLFAAIPFAGLASLAGAAPVIVATDSQTNGTDSLPHTYTVSSTDLLNGLTATNVVGNFTQEGTGGTPVLTDGSFPTIVRPLNFGVFATGGNTGGTSLTYNLSSPRNLTSIVTYGGWQDGGRDQQAYTVSYATALAPTTFIPITTVDFNPPDPGAHPQVTRVTITDTTGLLAANVAALKWDFNATENGYSGYSEFDAFGTPVPEPTSLGVLALGGLGLLARKRRGA